MIKRKRNNTQQTKTVNYKYLSCTAVFRNNRNSCAAFLISSIFAGRFTRIIKARIKSIEIFCIQLFLNRTKCLTKTLEMHNFSCPKETDRVSNLRNISYHTEDIIISGACFLLWGDFVRTTLHNII